MGQKRIGVEVLTGAERAKKYRDRVKQNKDKYYTYLEKARSRVKKNYSRKSERKTRF